MPIRWVTVLFVASISLVFASSAAAQTVAIEEPGFVFVGNRILMPTDSHSVRIYDSETGEFVFRVHIPTCSDEQYERVYGECSDLRRGIFSGRPTCIKEAPNGLGLAVTYPRGCSATLEVAGIWFRKAFIDREGNPLHSRWFLIWPDHRTPKDWDRPWQVSFEDSVRYCRDAICWQVSADGESLERIER